MQNIKNFTQTKPVKAQLKKYGAMSKNIIFLISEDGQRWDECQALFSDDTVKIMYDSEGVIRSVVDKPVPQRGNTYAVSMFFPLGMSVAEIAVDDYPAGCDTYGNWKFDGTTIYQDEETVNSRVYQNNLGIRNKAMSNAATYAFAIQSSEATGTPREGDADSLLAIQQYADALRDVDLTAAEPAWPAAPSFL